MPIVCVNSTFTNMHIFKATESDYNVVKAINNNLLKYPLLRDDEGTHTMYGISPIHGRSFMMKKRSDTDWVISKGNGLCYSSKSFVVSNRVDTNIWGALSLNSATRDFALGEEVRSLGVKTNKMEYVLELNYLVGSKDNKTNAALLQYSVECPYRICDFAFAPRSIIETAIKGWQSKRSFSFDYLKAADILIGNLRTLHSNNIM